MKLPVVLATLCATQAQALSCLAPDPVTSFNAAADSDLPYLVVTGTITTAETPPLVEGQEARIPARLTGKGLALDGFTSDFDEQITLVRTCAGPWCGFLPDDEPVMVFTRVDEGQPAIDLDPCGQWVFPAPDADLQATMTQCLNDGRCLP